MKLLFCLLFGTFLVFGMSYVPTITVAQTDEERHPSTEQPEEGMDVEEGVQTPDAGAAANAPADQAPPEDDMTPPDEDENIEDGASEDEGE
jgi:hypothetical protein